MKASLASEEMFIACNLYIFFNSILAGTESLVTGSASAMEDTSTNQLTAVGMFNYLFI